MTLGADGVCWGHLVGGSTVAFRYFDAAPVETTRVRSVIGAGDSFLGGLSFGIASGLSMEESIGVGNRCAGLSLQSLRNVSEKISKDTVLLQKGN